MIVHPAVCSGDEGGEGADWRLQRDVRRQSSLLPAVAPLLLSPPHGTPGLPFAPTPVVPPPSLSPSRYALRDGSWTQESISCCSRAAMDEQLNAKGSRPMWAASEPAELPGHVITWDPSFEEKTF